MTNEELAVIEVVLDCWDSVKEGDFGRLASHYDPERFTLFSEHPPHGLERGERALLIKRGLITQVSGIEVELDGIEANVFGDVAVVTYTVSYKGMLVYQYRFEGQLISVTAFCTTVLIRQRDGWKIVHEHFTRLPEGSDLTSRSTT
jgi:ketosteroid isomerase-like protein